MKKIYNLITLLFFAIFLHFTVEAQPNSCTTTCSYNGCSVNFTQTTTNYTITTTCDDGYNHTDTYPGDHTGTICGGVEPCSLPQEA